MKEFELPLRKDMTTDEIVAAVEQAASSEGLVATRSSLRSYPGSIHWHFRLPRQSGTLEATWFPQKSQLWLTCHDNRYKEWIEEKIQAFQQHFQRQYRFPEAGPSGEEGHGNINKLL